MEHSEKTSRPPLMRRGLWYRILKGIAIGLGVLFISALIYAIWAFRTGRAAEFVRTEIVRTLQDECGVNTAFKTLTLDPLALEVSLDDLVITDAAKQQLVGVEMAIVSLRVLPLFYGRLQFDRIAVLRPEATLAVVNGQLLNLPECLSGGSAEAPSIAVGVDSFTVERGRFVLRVDDVLSAELEDIGLALRPGDSGGADIAIGLDESKIELQGKKIPLHRLRLLGHLGGRLLEPRALLIDELDLELGKVRATGSATLDALGPVYEANLRVQAPLAAVHDFVDGAPPLEGEADVQITVAGTAINPRGAGTIGLKNAVIDTIGLGDEVVVGYQINREGVKLNSIDGKLGKGRVAGSGELSFDEQLRFSANATTKGLSFGELLDTLGLTGPWVDFESNGEVALSGTLVPLAIEGPFSTAVDDFVVFDGAFNGPEAKEKFLALEKTTAKGRWGFTDDGITFTNVTLASGNTVAVGQAKVAFDPEVGLDLSIDFPSFDFVDIAPIAGLRFEGVGRATGFMKGPYDRMFGGGFVDLEDIAVGDIPFGSAKGNVEWRNLTDLNFTEIKGRLGESPYQGRVQVALEGEVPIGVFGTLDRGRVQDALIPFGLNPKEWGDPNGQLDARFALQGPVNKLTGPLDLVVRDATILGEKVRRGRVVGRISSGRIFADSFEFYKYEGRIFGSGMLDPNARRVRVDASSRTARISHFDLVRETQPHLDGRLDAKLSLAGSFDAVTGTITAALQDMSAGPKPLGSGRFFGKIRGSNIELVGDFFPGLTYDGVVSVARGLPFRGKLTFENIDAPGIWAGLQNHERYSGNVRGVAQLFGTLVEWQKSSGTVRLEEATLELPSLRLASGALSRLTLRQGVLQTRSFVLVGPETRLTFSGRMGGDLLDLKTTGRVDLAILELTSPSVEKAGGTLTVDGAIGGSFKRPNMLGTGKVEGGFLQWRAVESRLTSVTAQLSFSQSSVLIDRSTARWAGGRLRATGTVQLEEFLPGKISMSVVADAVRPRFTYPKVDISGKLDGELQVTGTLDKLWVRGKMDVRQGKLRPKFDLRTLIQSQDLSVYDPAEETLEMDIAFHSREPVRMQNADMNVELLGDVRLTGTNERYGMIGQGAVVTGGRVAFLNREYELERGTIELRDRYAFDPKYDLVLTSQACGASIRVNLAGTLENWGTNYSSNPEMDDQDALSCLISGVRSTVGDSDEELANLAGIGANALLKLSGVDQEVKKVIPVDQIDVSTEYSSAARAYEPRVLIGKDISLLDRPIRLEYSSSLVRTNDQRAAMRIRLTPRLNLQFGWEQSEDVPLGDLGLDLKHRWEW